MRKPSGRPLKLPSNSTKAKVENKALWNEARSATDSDFYTFGYEGRKTPDIVDSLLAANVKCVLDIRYNPVSMYRPELSRSNLQSLLQRHDIEYLHVREWGVPRDIRARAADAGTREPIWEWYDEAVVRPFFERNLHRFLNMGYPLAMMCTECDPTECHRHRIFLALERQGLKGYDL